MQNTFKIQKAAGITTGISLLLMAVLAILAYGVLQGQIFVFDQGALDMVVFRAQSALLVPLVLAWISVVVLDLIVSLSLYKTYQSAKNPLNAVSSLLRIVYTIILATAVFFLVLLALGGGDDGAIVLQNLQSFESIWSWGLIIFGLHLMVLGFLVFEVQNRFWGIALIIAGFGYFAINVLTNLFPSLNEFTVIFENIMMLPMTVGELGLGIYLLVKGFAKDKAQSIKVSA
jgi:hypothetical protein